jgi:ATP diphosphatase
VGWEWTESFRPSPTGACSALKISSPSHLGIAAISKLIYIDEGMPLTTGELFERAVSIMARLRGPGGCPWDREQTFDSVKPYTVEETYEVLEAIDNRDWSELSGELGDLLLQVLFYAQMAKEQGEFSIDDVLGKLSDKLVRRHPHVFGDVKANTSSEVLRNWEALKRQEKRKPTPESILEGVSSAMPALLEAHKLSAKAAAANFDWPDVEGIFDKLSEETKELQEELQQYPAPGPQPQPGGIAGSGRPPIPAELQERLEAEIGDLFFVLVNMARYLSVDSESALKKSNRKFKKRYQWMEKELKKSGRTTESSTAEYLDALWRAAKQAERANP